MIIEENIFEHNGWYSQAGSGGPGLADMFEQNLYIMTPNNAIVRNNIFSRAASINLKYSAEVDQLGDTNYNLVDNNLFIDGEVGISVWNYNPDARKYTSFSITNNVLTNIGRSKPTNRALSWGIGVADIGTGVISGNIIMNQLDPTLEGWGFQTRGYLLNLSFTNNVLSNLYRIDAFQLTYDASNPQQSVSVSSVGNKIYMPVNGGYIATASYTPTSWSFADNTYYTSKSDETRFSILGTNKTDSEWSAETGDNSTFGLIIFPDQTRSVETYMQTLGETGAIDTFITNARAQDRYNWNAAYTAPVVNSYIRAGFGIEDGQVDPQPSVNTRLRKLPGGLRSINGHLFALPE